MISHTVLATERVCSDIRHPQRENVSNNHNQHLLLNDELIQLLLSFDEKCDDNDEPLNEESLIHHLSSLFDRGASIEARNENLLTPLHIASALGYANVVSYLIDDKKANIETRDEWYHTPLHLAAASGREEVVDILIKKGANKKAVDKFKKTPRDSADSGNGQHLLKALDTK